MLMLIFQLEESEAAAASQCFKSKDFVLGTGVVLEGVKYYVLQADDERVIGRKGSSGFFIYTSNRGDCLQVKRNQFHVNDIVIHLVTAMRIIKV